MPTPEPPPAIATIRYYRVTEPTSGHFTRVGLCIGGNGERLTPIFPDRKQADFAPDQVEAYHPWGQA